MKKQVLLGLPCNTEDRKCTIKIRVEVNFSTEEMRIMDIDIIEGMLSDFMNWLVMLEISLSDFTHVLRSALKTFVSENIEILKATKGDVVDITSIKWPEFSAN